MEKKSVLITLAVACNLLIALIALIHKRPDRFRYERSGVIQAPAEAIFPYLSNLKLGMEWSPYEKKDPNMRRVFRDRQRAWARSRCSRWRPIRAFNSV